MILDILLGLSLLAVLVLLRACYCWGKARGELKEFLRNPPEKWPHREHFQAEWKSEVENDNKAL